MAAVATKSKTKKKLPKKLSDCLELALHDLEACEKDPHYAVKMSWWHVLTEAPNGKHQCEVCLGGAVMAKSLNACPLDNVDPDVFADPVKNRLYALDNLRRGSIHSAFQNLGRGTPDVPYSVDVVSYEDDPQQFKRDMRRIVRLLRKVGA